MFLAQLYPVPIDYHRVRGVISVFRETTEIVLVNRRGNTFPNEIANKLPMYTPKPSEHSACVKKYNPLRPRGVT